MVKIEKIGDKKVISIEGEMTIFNATTIASSIDISDCQELDIDLSNVTDFDTSGLQILVAIRKEAVNKNIKTRFLNLSEPIENLLNIFRLKDYLIRG